MHNIFTRWYVYGNGERRKMRSTKQHRGGMEAQINYKSFPAIDFVTLVFCLEHMCSQHPFWVSLSCGE